MQTRSHDIVTITLVLEGLLLLVATAWSYFAQIALLPAFHFNGNLLFIGTAGGVGLSLSSAVLMWIGKASGGRLKMIADLEKIMVEEVAPLFSKTTVVDILLIALTSGFCEEVFFRGVAQSALGIWIASVVFGAFHCPTMKYISYGIWAICAGLALGYSLEYTHSLWVPIIAHTVNNFLGMLYLRYGIKPAAPV